MFKRCNIAQFCCILEQRFPGLAMQERFDVKRCTDQNTETASERCKTSLTALVRNWLHFYNILEKTFNRMMEATKDVVFVVGNTIKTFILQLISPSIRM